MPVGVHPRRERASKQLERDVKQEGRSRAAHKKRKGVLQALQA
ncbi:hypothetical protein [Janthinobacterium sp. PSPC2-1]